MKEPSASHDYELSTVPAHARRGFFVMFSVMVSFTLFSASMWAGGTLGQGLSMTQFIIAVLLGNALLAAYASALAIMSSRTGLSTHLISRYAFGVRGSWLPSFLLGGTQVGWFGVGIAMFALPIHAATGINNYLLIVIGGILMTSTAYLGFKALAILGFFAVPSIVVLGVWSMGVAVDTAGGLGALMEIEPVERLSMATALTVCIGSFISGATLTPDFVRFARTTRIGVIATVIAFFLGNSLMFSIGAVGALVYGEADVSQVLFAQGLIVLAILVLGLNIWTTNDNALYAASLGFANITRYPKRYLVLFNGTVGTLLSVWLYDNFVGWLTFLSSALPPIGAVLIADYFILARGRYPALEHAKLKDVHWMAIASWAIGCAAANLLPGIPPLNAIIFALIAHVAGGLAMNRILERRSSSA